MVSPNLRLSDNKMSLSRDQYLHFSPIENTLQVAQREKTNSLISFFGVYKAVRGIWASSNLLCGMVILKSSILAITDGGKDIYLICTNTVCNANVG